MYTLTHALTHLHGHTLPHESTHVFMSINKQKATQVFAHSKRLRQGLEPAERTALTTTGSVLNWEQKPDGHEREIQSRLEHNILTAVFTLSTGCIQRGRFRLASGTKSLVWFIKHPYILGHCGVVNLRWLHLCHFGNNPCLIRLKCQLCPAAYVASNFSSG